LKFSQNFVKEIDALLPQTQCRQCGFDGCEPYAEAIVAGQADINQCPPGDTAVIDQIAVLLGIATKPLNIRHGLPKPKTVSVIDETRCIGCTFCIRACPVDAIVGAAKQMHTVIADECTGCELCVAPCPMDCIQMVPASVENSASMFSDTKKKADRARLRFQFRLQRLGYKKSEVLTNTMNTVEGALKHLGTSDQARKKAIVQAALDRAAAVRERQISSHDLKSI